MTLEEFYSIPFGTRVRRQISGRAGTVRGFATGRDSLGPIRDLLIHFDDAPMYPKSEIPMGEYVDYCFLEIITVERNENA